MQFYIETPRLILRDLLPEDTPGMFEMDSDAEVHRYLGRKPVNAIEESATHIGMIRAQYINNGIGRWAVTEKASGNFMGWGGLKLMTEPINRHSNHYDLGYRFIKRYWGMGYATEVAAASVQYGWDVLKLKEIYAIADMGNMASRKVLEKTGMQFMGTFDYEGDEHAWYELIRNR